MEDVIEAVECKATSEATVDGIEFILLCQYLCCLVDCSIDCENDENLLKGWKVTLKFDVNAVRSHASRWLETSLVVSEHRFIKNMVEMKMLSSLYSILSDMEKEDKVVKDVMDSTPAGNGLRYTLATVGNNRDEVVLKRLTDVGRSAKAKEVLSKVMRPCQKRCYFGLCTFDCQSNTENLYDGELIFSKFQTDALCTLPSRWLERFWRSQVQYEEILSLRTLDRNLVELIASVIVNLTTVYAATLGIILNYPGKYFPGDFILQIILLFNLCCLGLVLPLMTCCLQALDPTDENSRK